MTKATLTAEQVKRLPQGSVILDRFDASWEALPIGAPWKSVRYADYGETASDFYPYFIATRGPFRVIFNPDNTRSSE